MITEEEKQEIIDKAVEKALLLVPETVGNMMTHQAVLSKLNREFYGKYPEFKNSKDSVVAAIERVEGENPLDGYEDILKKAVPEIKRRIGILKDLDMKTVQKTPDRDFSKSFKHGEI